MDYKVNYENWLASPYLRADGLAELQKIADDEKEIEYSFGAEMEFGTGCVKMTPAHDPNDFEVGLRHNLDVIRVLNDDGTFVIVGSSQIISPTPVVFNHFPVSG